MRAARKDLMRQGDCGRRKNFVRHPERDLANLGSITSLDGAKQRGPRWSTVGMRRHGIASNFAERDTSLELATFGLGSRRSTN
jgi:hypothetical protein